METGEFDLMVIHLLTVAACQSNPSPDLDQAVWCFMFELEGRRQGAL